MRTSSVRKSQAAGDCLATSSSPLFFPFPPDPEITSPLSEAELETSESSKRPDSSCVEMVLLDFLVGLTLGLLIELRTVDTENTRFTSFEVIVASYEGSLCSELEAAFASDLEESEEVVQSEVDGYGAVRRFGQSVPLDFATGLEF